MLNKVHKNKLFITLLVLMFSFCISATIIQLGYANDEIIKDNETKINGPYTITFTIKNGEGKICDSENPSIIYKDGIFKTANNCAYYTLFRSGAIVSVTEYSADDTFIKSTNVGYMYTSDYKRVDHWNIPGEGDLYEDTNVECWIQDAPSSFIIKGSATWADTEEPLKGYSMKLSAVKEDGEWAVIHVCNIGDDGTYQFTNIPWSIYKYYYRISVSLVQPKMSGNIIMVDQEDIIDGIADLENSAYKKWDFCVEGNSDDVRFEVTTSIYKNGELIGQPIVETYDIYGFARGSKSNYFYNIKGSTINLWYENSVPYVPVPTVIKTELVVRPLVAEGKDFDYWTYLGERIGNVEDSPLPFNTDGGFVAHTKEYVPPMPPTPIGPTDPELSWEATEAPNTVDALPVNLIAVAVLLSGLALTFSKKQKV